MGDSSKKEFVFITLGDGDFTWSLDLGRYLISCCCQQNGNSSSSCLVNDLHRLHKIQLIATGIDTLEELHAKYKNTPYILREWNRLLKDAAATSMQEEGNTSLRFEMHHGINAIVDTTTTTSTTSPDETTSHRIPSRGNVVIFNHPHLGIEDAILHSEFLCHLFHSIRHYWLNCECSSGDNNNNNNTVTTTGSVFCLTLVRGQYERWNCHEAAQRSGMVLIHRSRFVPTPPTNPTIELLYEHRRHQTGKSFASRSDGSETFCFIVRGSDDDAANMTTDQGRSQALAVLSHLPWFSTPIDSTEDVTAAAVPSTTLPFACTICSKSFREQRSLKNHMHSKHPPSSSDGVQLKRKRIEDVDDDTTNPNCYTCSYCSANDSSSSGPRVFHSLAAMKDHIRAKHNAIHTSIPPDWSIKATSSKEFAKTTSTDLGTCSICGHIYNSEIDQSKHRTKFIPSMSGTSENCSQFACRFCSRQFRQQRAQLQHENFCPSRTD